MKLFFLLLLLGIPCLLQAQDSTYLQVHFLYGSKPHKAYKSTEKSWFGGIMGGHVGVAVEDNKIVNFVMNGKFRVFTDNDYKHSRFKIHDFDGFYSLFGGEAKQHKKAIIYIPISWEQKQQFDSITAAYLLTSPYDYAFIGMRCGAAAYDIISQLAILPKYNNKTTYTKIFYPQRLREQLLDKAALYNWRIVREEGSSKRIWEKD